MADNRMIRRRKALFTEEEAAREIGVSVDELLELEESFLSEVQKSYLRMLNYCHGFYPRRKKRERALLALEKKDTEG